jgi:MYXO-CTERM domain-containing protein
MDGSMSAPSPRHNGVRVAAALAALTLALIRRRRSGSID